MHFMSKLLRRFEIVPYWRRGLKLPSVWFSALGAAFMSWLSADPLAPLHLWQGLPYEIKSLISPRMAAVLAGVAWFLSWLLSRFLRKKPGGGQ